MALCVTFGYDVGSYEFFLKHQGYTESYLVVTCWDDAFLDLSSSAAVKVCQHAKTRSS